MRKLHKKPGDRRIDTSKPSCGRCGRPGLRVGRVLKTNRTVCFWCYGELDLGPDNLMIDDGIAHTWEETQRARAEQRQAMRRNA